MKLQKIDINVETLHTDTAFMDKYNKMFETILCTLVKKFKVDWKQVILCKDAPRSELWRNDLYTSYKSEREQSAVNFNVDVFRSTYDHLIPALKEKFGFQEMSIARMEADDIIAVIVETLQSKTNKMIIITNDNDYLQLLKYNVEIMNMQGKDLKDRLKDHADVYLKTKCILGDKSDSIPSITKLVGPKTADKLSKDDSLLEALFKKTPEAKAQYELNRALIDMSLIPEVYKNSVIENITLV